VIIANVVMPFLIRQSFKYFVPDSIIPVIGARVVVPFHSKDKIGVIVSFNCQHKTSKLNFKFIKLLIDNKPLYTKILFDLLTWLSNYYFCPKGIIFFYVLPKRLKTDYIIKKKYCLKWSITKKGQEIDIQNFNLSQKQRYNLFFLKKSDVFYNELKKYNLSKFVLKKLELKHLCESNLFYTDYLKVQSVPKIKKKIFLNKKAIFCVDKILSVKKFSSWLITKTSLFSKVKFYISLIQKILDKKMQILILVPYEKNIKKIISFLKMYFDISIGTIHCQLTDSEHLKNWIKIKDGEYSIVIGTKKNIFSPFLKLGLIIVYEEHNLYYKNLHQFRYNARDVAVLRAYKENIPIILDSDTPSLKTLHNVFFKKCIFLKISNHTPIVNYNCDNVINLKSEKIKSGLSLTLINKIYENLKKNHPVLLIFNKINLVFFGIICKNCGWVAKCSVCCDYLETKPDNNNLFCQYCLIKIKKPKFCCSCGFYSLHAFNFSIDQIKNRIKSIFPHVSLFFLLNKKMSKKTQSKYLKIYDSKSYVICVMEDLVKYYYFPYVKLIGLIGIDHFFFLLISIQ